jgi:hypothetical protein
MTPSKLAICFGPALMGQRGTSGVGDITDANWQARVVETILNNTFQIFDDDEPDIGNELFYFVLGSGGPETSLCRRSPTN